MNRWKYGVAALGFAGTALVSPAAYAAEYIDIDLNGSFHFQGGDVITNIAVANPAIADVVRPSGFDSEVLIVGVAPGSTNLFVWYANGAVEDYVVTVGIDDIGQARAIQRMIGLPRVRVQVVPTEGGTGRRVLLRGTVKNQAEHDMALKVASLYTGDTTEPYEVLYHMNMGYPLLDEDSVVAIPSAQVTGRDDHAAEDIANWMHMEKPQDGYQEKCYYHTFADKDGSASIFQPKLGMGLTISFDTRDLDCFCEWKSMRTRDYALGLECGNCLPDGRDVMREKGILKFLAPGESKTYTVRVTMKDAQ